MKELFILFNHVKVYRGDSCGIGKTHTIKQNIDSKKSLEYERIPIYGDLNREKLIELHKAKLFKENENGYLVPK